MAAIKILASLIVVLLVAALGFIYSGVYNVSAEEPHLGVTRWALETARHRSVAVRDNPEAVPTDLDDAQRIERGAQRYAAMCEKCHLAPGIEATPLHRGLNPTPPRFGEAGANHAPEYVFWVVKNGIKMTGMPAWGLSHEDDELWDLVAFVKRMKSFTESEYRALAQKSVQPKDEK